MASTTSTIRVGETGPPRHRTMLLRRGTRLGVIAAALTAAATVAAVGAPTVGAAVPTHPATTRVLLSIVNSGTTPDQVTATVTRLGGHVVAQYDVADALLVELPAGAAAPIGTTAVADVPLHVTAVTTSATSADVSGATYRATIGAPTAARGVGITVAVVDTGVAEVTDLAGRITHVNVSGGAGGDGLGHGTFMAGLIAGDGTASGGTYTGVAPAARILDVQVATADGSTSLSRVLAGLQAVSDRAGTDSSLRVVSLALSTGNPLPPSSDPFARALDRLWARGLTVIVSAGNDGPDKGTVTTPGADPTLITVGALDEQGTSARGDDTVSDFSSRGTDFGTKKPDLVAPGAHLISTRAPGSIADVENPASRVLDDYFTGSGTSMSEAITAGAAAVLLSSRAALTPATVKRLLTTTAYRSTTLEKRDGAGAGGLDLATALAKAATAKIVASERSAADLVVGVYGPDPADAAAWQQFSDAWDNGDLTAVGDAWATLSEQTRRWAGTAFALSLISDNPGVDQDEYAALTALARSWATQAWDARSWATDTFVARSWAARSWAARSWAIDEWAARSWADSSFTARSWAQTDWSARSWADAQFTARSWAARSWAARSWADDSWTARSWAQTDWLAFSWTARSWAARSWASEAWTNQAWSARSWAARSWADLSWAARSWAVGDWTARSWATDSWGQQA